MTSKVILIIFLILLYLIQNASGYIYDTLDEKGNKSVLEDYYFPTHTEEDELNEFVKNWARRNKSYTQELEYYRIRSFISRITTFDHYYISNGKRPYSAYGALSDGKSVCMGYALLAKKFFDIKGIENLLIHDKQINHLYNRVSLDGFWHNVDIMWYDANEENLKYERELEIRVQKILRGEW